MGLWEDVEVKEDDVKISTIELDTVKSRKDLVSLLANKIKNNSEEKKDLLDLYKEQCGIEIESGKISLFSIFSFFRKKRKKEQYKTKSENEYLVDSKKSISLISNLLASNPSNSKIEKLYDEFVQFLETDYMEFADIDDLPNEAEMYGKLLKIRDRIENTMKFPELLNKIVIGIGGGFSAGKSSFVNAILGSDTDILPTDTRPTTSISTYVVKGKKDLGIYAYNIFGDKLLINKEALLAISHEFNRVHNLTLSTVIKKISIDTKMMKYNKVVFLDTPGYSKAEFKSKNDNTDEKTAKDSLALTDYLIWVVDIERGVIPKSDLDFLDSLDFKKPLFVILNKADKKPEKDIADIIETTTNTLESKGFNVENVVAYSSHEKREIGSSNGIASFLEDKNKSTKTNSFLSDINEIFEVYEEHHDSSIKKVQNLLTVLNKVDTLSYKLLEELPEFQETLKDTRALLRERKKVQRDLKILEEKVIPLITKIDNFFS